MGVTNGLAGIKFSTSPRRLGASKTINDSPVSISSAPSKSFTEKNGWNGILSRLEFKPIGLLDPVW